MKAVCVDGPLKGRIVDMGPRPSPVGAIKDLSLLEGSDTVTYYPRKFGFTSGGFSVLLWLMVTEAEPSAEALADILLSDVAKEALIREGQ
jgi:hypothetical protein